MFIDTHMHEMTYSPEQLPERPWERRHLGFSGTG